jgi:hypothetical protein
MRRFLLKLIRRRRLHEDLEAELAFHREMSSAHGNPISLGNVSRITEESLDLWRFSRIENLWRDLIYGARTLARSRTLVVTALLSFGLGIGVNAVVFSLAVELLLSQPSVTDASSLVSVRFGGNSHAPFVALDFLRRSGMFQDVVGDNAELLMNFDNGTETLRMAAGSCPTTPVTWPSSAIVSGADVSMGTSRSSARMSHSRGVHLPSSASFRPCTARSSASASSQRCTCPDISTRRCWQFTHG